MKIKYLFLLVSLLFITSCNLNNSLPNSSNSIESFISSEEYSSSVINNSSFTSNEVLPNVTKDKVEIINFGGYFESCYFEWYPVVNAKGYNVYYSFNNINDWKSVDDELIRYYGDYFRVDILGLKKGDYKVKIIPIIDSNEDQNKSEEQEVSIISHLREGFAFVNGSSSGAYNEDGTLKNNARVIYITNDNKDTISLDITGATSNPCVGLQNILNGYKKKKDTRPLCVRLIGNITDLSILDKGDIVIDNNIQGLTIEGVGNDTVLNGWGIRIKNSSNVEIRNVATMNCDSNEGDNISLQQDNDHIWIHNNDFFYGHAGSDADQAKGDGALDTKESSYVTHSFNHFFDSGKANLQGMKDETTENYITYHHNWFDHSDSRHPRVRTCTVHIYNNYYDGNSKYGIGATMGASLFVEGNYFRNTKLPMLISLQGSDISQDKEGKGTFSGENGGIIKAFDNYMEGQKAFVSYEENNIEFDAYVVKSRDELVPSTVKTKSGNYIYNNFDTLENMYNYTYETPSNAKNTVINYAGRLQGGDFKWKFNNEIDDKSYDVDINLKNALINYESKLISVGGDVFNQNPSVNITSKEVIELINNLKSIDDITIDDEDYINYVKYCYDSLDNNAKEEVNNYNLLEAALLKIEELKNNNNNDSLIDGKIMSLSASDITNNIGSINGFTYSINGKDNDYMKLRYSKNNYISYDISSENINLELTAKCIDSSEIQTFQIEIKYEDNTKYIETIELLPNKQVKTYNINFKGNIISFKILGINSNVDKNLGISLIKLKSV